MNNLLIYLVELNIALLILYAAYRLFFEKDKNFVIRRIYLLGILVLPVILPLIPTTIRMAANRLAPVSFNLEEITIYAYAPEPAASGSFIAGNILLYIYLAILFLGLARLTFQLWGIYRAIQRSERMEVDGKTVLTNAPFHASSFFGYIFMDTGAIKDHSFSHILEHEQVHRKEWHSVDRILVELFVVINWFNPVAWMYRKAVIENLEYLADSAVISRGTNPANYQLSILNQYIGSASIQNQFSSQIKNRINMLNKDYKLGSSWKLVLIVPLICVAIVAISCSDRDSDAIQDGEEVALKSAAVEDKIYAQVDEMPTFNGEDPVMPFRKFIAQNLVYPDLAKERSVSGKVFVKFVVRKDGAIEIPTKEEIASIEGKPIGEVVVVGYKPLDENAPEAKKEDIELLQNEGMRVVLSSPKWEPGKVNGLAVDVMYTIPINFVLQ